MRLPLVAPLGSRIPLRSQIPGRAFRQTPQPETTSHSKGKFRDTASATPPIRKAHPTLDTFGYGIISHLLGLGSATWRPPGGVLLHESHRMVRKEARVRFVAVLHLAIHPANACECVVQDGLVIGVMENVVPNACHGCARECQEKSLEDFEAFTSSIISHARQR